MEWVVIGMIVGTQGLESRVGDSAVLGRPISTFDLSRVFSLRRSNCNFFGLRVLTSFSRPKEVP